MMTDEHPTNLLCVVLAASCERYDHGIIVVMMFWVGHGCVSV
jgi:hypothetical protein